MWDNPEYARGILQKKSNLEKQLNELNHLESEYKNLCDLYELSPEDTDVNNAINELAESAHKAKFITLFSDPMDDNGAFLFIQSGAGGTEAQDWAQMLKTRFFNRNCRRTSW